MFYVKEQIRPAATCAGIVFKCRIRFYVVIVVPAIRLVGVFSLLPPSFLDSARTASERVCINTHRDL